MAKSHKPIVWGPFAAGGTFAAFFNPVLILVTGILVPLGLLSGDVLSYTRAHEFAGGWIGKLILFAFVALPAWHAAHRLRITVHDFGVRADILVAVLVYASAALATVVAIVSLLAI
ncbi:MAG: fumarate reductase subunit D [Alphaproteobacteria bacterium]|nr:fumarate reductase subunit D [Alphaproteobacteria bacterium]